MFITKIVIALHVYRNWVSGGKKKMWFRDFPGGSVAKTALSKPGVQVRSLVRELDLTYCN